MKHGILIISHGSRDAAWVTQVEDTVEAAKTIFYEHIDQGLQQTIEQAKMYFPIECAYLELVEGKSIQDGLHTLQNKGVTHLTVLPLFVSAGSTHVEEIKQAFGYSPAYDFIGDLEPFNYTCSVSFDLPLIADDELVQIVQRQLSKLLSEHSKLNAALIVGHGSTDTTYYSIWEQGMKELLQRLEQASHAKEQELELDYASLLPDNTYTKLAAMIARGKQVAVIPLFLSAGYFTRRVIPEKLGELDYIYTGEALLPSEEMIQLLVRRFITQYNKENKHK